MDAWLAIPLLLIPFALGAGTLRVLGIHARADRLGWLGWSWAIGALGTGALVFLWAQLRLPWNGAALGGVLSATALGLFLLAKRRQPPPLGPAEDTAWTRAKPLERALFLGVLFLLLASYFDRVLLASLRPLWSMDEALLFSSRAKMLFTERGFSPGFGEATRASFAIHHPDYPPLNPLLQVWTYSIAGRIVHFASRLPIQAFALALLFTLASALRRRVSPLPAAALLVLFASARGTDGFDLLTKAYSDCMCALGLLIAVDAWMRFEERGERAWVVLAALGLALATASKNEGTLFALVFGSVLFLRLIRGRLPHSLPLRSFWMMAAVALLPALASGLVNRRYGFEGDLLSTANAAGQPMWELLPSQLAERTLPVLRFVGKEVILDPVSTRLLFLAFLAIFLLFPRRAFRGPVAVVSAVLLLLAAAFIVVFIASPNELAWHLRTAGQRVYGQLLATVTLWVGVTATSVLRDRPEPG